MDTTASPSPIHQFFWESGEDGSWRVDEDAFPAREKNDEKKKKFQHVSHLTKYS